MEKKIGLYWLKRDFRLSDNPALTAALETCDHVIPLYIIEPSMLSAGETSEHHLYAIQSAFNHLRSDYKNRGASLYHLKSEVVNALDNLYNAAPFQYLFSHEEIGVNRTYKRDIAVLEWCQSKNVHWQELKQTGVFRGMTDRDQRGKLWRNFYESPVCPIPSKKAFDQIKIDVAYQNILKDDKITDKSLGVQLLDQKKNLLQKVSEESALDTLDSFMNERGIQYSGGISSPITAFTAGSRMSVHLAWGTISGRTVYQRNLQKKEEYKEHPDGGKWRRSLTAFQARLHWRDHFIQRLETEPQMEFQSLNEAYESIDYDGTPEMLNAWINGTTGYPMVDACIRCLRTTGFINFRMRAMLTSFACHVLHLSWKDIDHPMARMYTDYEPGIHLSQLQMQAGVVGINTIRIYSPTKQIIDQDPECVFIKEWVPELLNHSPEAIINHIAEPIEGYAPPIVDYKVKSKEMRSQLWSIKSRKETKEIAARVYEKHGSRKRPSRGRQKTKS